VELAPRGGFSVAARSLRLTPSAVSKRLATDRLSLHVEDAVVGKDVFHVDDAVITDNVAARQWRGMHVTRSGRDGCPCRQRGSQQDGCPQHPPVHAPASRRVHDSSSGRRTDGGTADGTSVTSIRRTEQELTACSMPASAVPPSTPLGVNVSPVPYRLPPGTSSRAGVK